MSAGGADLDERRWLRPLRWIYRRFGQMSCFAAGGALLLFTSNEEPDLQDAVIGCSLLFVGVALKAIFHWRRAHDPTWNAVEG